MNEQPPVAPSAVQQGELPGAWSLFKPSMHALGFNFGTWISLILVPVATLVVGVIIASILSHSSSVAAGIVIMLTILAFLAVAFMATPALTITILRGARDQKVGFQQAWDAGMPLIGRMIGLGFAVAALAVLGLILLVVPGLFVIKRYMLASYYLVDQNLSIGEAMRRSAAASRMKKATWGILWVDLLFSALGNIPLLGLIATICSIMYSAAPAVRYLQVKELEGHGAPAHPVAHSTAAPVQPVQ